MNNQPAVAIIGAGPAGIHCALALIRRGTPADRIRIFEKSRGVGGRVASRRRPGFEWHHGAAVVDLAAGRSLSAKTCRIALKAATDPLTITFGSELRSIEPAGVGAPGWSLIFEGRETVRCETLLLCLPAPQILRILRTSRLALASDLERVAYVPRFSLLLGLKRPLRTMPDLQRPFIDQSVGADGRSVVLHASPSWTRRHLELSRDAAALRLLNRVPRAMKVQGLLHVMAHRWRYALVAQPAGIPCFWDAERRLGCAGDWCFGATVAAATEAGVALAARV